MPDSGATYARLFKTVANTSLVKEAGMSALKKALLLGAGGLGLAGAGGGAGYLLGSSGAEDDVSHARYQGYNIGWDELRKQLIESELSTPTLDQSYGFHGPFDPTTGELAGGSGDPWVGGY